jgi:hypothetical protein
MRSSAAAILVALAAGTLGCSSPESFVALVLESTSTPIMGVDQITVTVTQAAETKTLTYPAPNLTFVDAGASVGTLSNGFSGSQSGDVRFDVAAFHGSCTAATGAVIVTIRRGATVEAPVQLMPYTTCPGDAGAPDLPPDSGFPGCDPNTDSCSPGLTCEVSCQHQANVCVLTGTSPPGSRCGPDGGCAAGSECFDYSTLGCPVEICLRLCGDDTTCTPLAGSVGPGSFCRDPLSCTNAYHTCSFSCDPTAGAATAGSSGCPSGLACVIPASMDHVDCACPGSTRTGKEDAPCTGTSQCAPGFLCEQTCRAVCRCDAQNGACTAPNDCATAGRKCMPVSAQTIYGVCL